MASRDISSEEASALAALTFNWSPPYLITFDGDTWSARYQGSTETLFGATAAELRGLIRADHAARRRPLTHISERSST
jgi:hypothetical protein